MRRSRMTCTERRASPGEKSSRWRHDGQQSLPRGVRGHLEKKSAGHENRGLGSPVSRVFQNSFGVDNSATIASRFVSWLPFQTAAERVDSLTGQESVVGGMHRTQSGNDGGDLLRGHHQADSFGKGVRHTFDR